MTDLHSADQQAGDQANRRVRPVAFALPVGADVAQKAGQHRLALLPGRIGSDNDFDRAAFVIQRREDDALVGFRPMPVCDHPAGACLRNPR